MKTAEYWAKRGEMRLAEGFAAADKVTAELAGAYRRMQREVDGEARRIIERYGQKYSLTYAEAVRDIDKSQYREWRMSLEDYVRRINETGDEALLRELDILSARSRATRWQQVETAIKVNASELAQKQEALVAKLLSGRYQSAYYRQAFDAQQGLGFGRALEMLAPDQVAQTLAYPWSGANFSERIWQQKQKLTDTLRQTLTEGLIQGQDMRMMTKRIEKTMDAGYRQAETLVRTETAHAIEQGTMDGYRAGGIERYEILAALDRRTSEICRGQDGKRYAVTDARPGVNMPPFHPNCRTTTVPVIDGDEAAGGMRAAKDDKGGYVLVPADMTYDKWYEEFVRAPEKARLAAASAEHNAMQNAGLTRVPDIDKLAQQKYNNSPAYHKLYKRYENLAGSGEWAAVEFNPPTLTDHFGRHGEALGCKSVKDYEAMALRFVNQVEEKQVVADKDGVKRFYLDKTNEFASVYPDGTIRTYYKPSKGLRYWERQVKLYETKDG